MNVWLLQNPCINLLQGDYQPKHKITSTKKIWLLASAVILAWVVLIFCVKLLSFFMLHHADTKMEQAINQIYRRQFPDATTIVAPRERLEGKLKSLSVTVNKNLFLTLLGVVGQQLVKEPDIHLKKLEFANNQLNLNVTAPTFASLDAFTQKLTKSGVKTKQQGATMTGNQVTANIFINEGI
jgi:type II secretion system protein L